MSDRWEHPRDAAAEAVVWALIASVAEENKKQARDYLVAHLNAENSRGVDAVANGQVIGSVTRSKPAEVVDVDDMPAFMDYVAQHHPDLLSIHYLAKSTLLRKLKEVDGAFVDPEGVVVPGISKRMSTGSVRVNPDSNAREVVRGLLAHARISLEGIRGIAARPTEWQIAEGEA